VRCPRKISTPLTALFPPLVILWAWIWQALDTDQSLSKALSRIHAHRAFLGLSPLSTDTGGYCKARKRPPEVFFKRIFKHLGASLSAEAPKQELWHCRRVKVVDGTKCSMPDTPANQKKYPQPPSQKKGCGFPLASIVVVFCLATGAALDMAIGRCNTHDLALFYFLRSIFDAGDVMLADRGFCSFAELALMKMRGVDVVTRLHQARFSGMKRFRMTAIREQTVRWTRPVAKPRGLRWKDYRMLPAFLDVRIIKYRVEYAGFRTKELEVVTTLLDSAEYPAKDMADLYFRRWEVEINFRHIKCTMKMDPLGGKSPGVVRREMFVHMIAYNLVRRVMYESAMREGISAVRMSFKGSIQTVSAHADLFAVAAGDAIVRIMDSLMRVIGAGELLLRPGRFEPRVRKRRPKSYPLMTRPRAELKAAMAA